MTAKNGIFIHTPDGEVEVTLQGLNNALVDKETFSDALGALVRLGEHWGAVHRHGFVRITREPYLTMRRSEQAVQRALPFNQHFRVQAAVTFTVPATISVDAGSYEEARAAINAWVSGRMSEPPGFAIRVEQDDQEVFFNQLDLGDYSSVEDIKPQGRFMLEFEGKGTIIDVDAAVLEQDEA